MSEKLGQNVGINVPNAYVSVSREGHIINITRFDALAGVTMDCRLLEFLTEPHGYAVIERRFLPAVEIAYLAAMVFSS